MMTLMTFPHAIGIHSGLWFFRGFGIRGNGIRFNGIRGNDIQGNVVESYINFKFWLQKLPLFVNMHFAKFCYKQTI